MDEQELERCGCIARASLRRLTHDKEAIDDLCQGVLLKCWRYWQSSNRCPCKRWVEVTTRNDFLRWLRRESRRKNVVGSLPGSFDIGAIPDKPDRYLEQSERLELLRLWVVELPPGCKDLALLRYQGISLARIAEQKHLPLGTVKSRWFFTLALLRKKRGEHDWN